MKEKNKKNFAKKVIYIFMVIILIILLAFLFKKTYEKLSNKKDFEKSVISFAEKNKKTVFSINKIVFFSSCDSKNKTSSITNFTIENLYAYTDLALFINNYSEENNTENTLKNLKISNIKFTKMPTIGKPNLYYKSVNNFAKSEINENNIIDNELKFEITSDSEANLEKPVLFNNCANPITLSYINQNIKTDYTLTDTQNPITYTIQSIDTTISFDVEIENNKNQKFKTTVYFDIPYVDNEKSIYDGNITIKKDTNFNFYRYE